MSIGVIAVRWPHHNILTKLAFLGVYGGVLKKNWPLGKTQIPIWKSVRETGSGLLTASRKLIYAPRPIEI